MNAATRILSTTGIITSEDRSEVLTKAAAILAAMRNAKQHDDVAVLSAALLCMSEDVAQSVREKAAHEGALATAELKAALCTRHPAPAAMVDLRKPSKASESWPWVALWVTLLVLVAGAALAKC
jgi:hypothetical protein